MEKRHLKGSTFFFPGKVNVGYFQKNEEVWLVDTGLDDEAGRKIARFLETEIKNSAVSSGRTQMRITAEETPFSKSERAV